MTRRARVVVACSLAAIATAAWSASPANKATVATGKVTGGAAAPAASAAASAAAAAPVEFSGIFAVGTTYVADVF